jgi:hypothetical protein
MDLLQYVHTRWAADGTLNGLLAATRVATGTYFATEPSFPYGTITLPGSFPEAHYNTDDSTETVTVRMAVYHHRDNYDEGLAIAAAVRDAFNRAAFDLSGSDKVLSMQRAGYEELQDDEGNWAFVSDFQCLVYFA